MTSTLAAGWPDRRVRSCKPRPTCIWGQLLFKTFYAKTKKLHCEFRTMSDVPSECVWGLSCMKNQVEKLLLAGAALEGVEGSA